MSYGPNLTDLWTRAAKYVDEILRCAKPGDLPVGSGLGFSSSSISRRPKRSASPRTNKRRHSLRANRASICWTAFVGLVCRTCVDHLLHRLQPFVTMQVIPSALGS